MSVGINRADLAHAIAEALLAAKLIAEHELHGDSMADPDELVLWRWPKKQ